MPIKLHGSSYDDFFYTIVFYLCNEIIYQKNLPKNRVNKQKRLQAMVTSDKHVIVAWDLLNAT